MTNYTFLKFFDNDLDLQLNTVNLLDLTKLSIEAIDIKLDALVESGYLLEHIEYYDMDYEDEILDTVQVTSRWLNDFVGDPDFYKAELRDDMLCVYSLSNKGLEYVSDYSRELLFSNQANIRSNIALLVSIASLILALFTTFTK